MSLKGPAAKDVDRYDTLLIRAEAQLQLKQQGPAIQSYSDAVKATDDPTKQGLPKAMMTLLKKSVGFQYTPKPSSDPTHPSSPLNILNDKDRKVALKALFDDEWKPKQAQIDSLKKRGNQSLQPIIEAAGIAGEMRGLEIAATGSDAETSTALSDLTDNAAKLMTDYLDRETKRVEDIDTRANRPTDDSSTNGYSPRTGLTAAQNTELKDVVATCQKLQLTAEQVAASEVQGQRLPDHRPTQQRPGQARQRRAQRRLQQSLNGPTRDPPIQRGGQQQNPNPMTLRPGRTAYALTTDRFYTDVPHSHHAPA